LSFLGSVVGAAASIFGANQAADAQKKSAKLQAKQFAETKELIKPYTDAGAGAVDAYKSGIGLNGVDKQTEFYNNFQNDPGFEAATNYATRGIENLNSIKGRGLGGNLIAGASDYLQKNMLDAYRTRLSQIGGLVDTGRSAASTLGTLGQQSAAAQGANLANAGYYQGAGLINAANGINQGLYNNQMMSAYSGGSAGGLSSFGNFFA
jgi:hypothetical protein